MFQSSNAELYWFLLGVVLMLSEMAIPGFVIFFFGVGAWITALCLWIGIGGEFNTQLIIFLGSLFSPSSCSENKGRSTFVEGSPASLTIFQSSTALPESVP